MRERDGKPMRHLEKQSWLGRPGQFCVIWIILAATHAARTQGRESSDARPNFIIIFCDDLGYADIEPFGSVNHRTPNINRLASEGMRLTSFYSTCCVCTPSRSSLMTGCYPQRVGMHESERGQWVLFPGNSRGINAQETTIAEVLSSAGYATGIIGKWHLGDQPAFLPTNHGFDTYFGIPYSNDMGEMDRPIGHAYPPTPLLVDSQVVQMEPDQRLITRRYTERAEQFLEDHHDQPFFLYLPHSMPHWPQYASQEYAYQSGNGPWGDAVEEIDWSTGRIMDKLVELGIDENTVVIFTSDNGGAVQHGANNRPLRGGKGSTWEGGQRVCCIARWPGKIKRGVSTSQLAVTFDLLPTFANLAGIDFSPDKPIDGMDISPVLLEQAQSPHEDFFYYFKGHINAVRSGPWKLFVKRREKQLEEPELYNLVSDVAETTNVASELPEIVARLKNVIGGMRSKLGDGAEAGSERRTAGSVEQARTLTMNAPDQLTTVDVFRRGSDNYHTFRIPSLVVSPRGSLLAICEGRKNSASDHGDLDLVMKRSDDHGTSWSEISVIYEEGGDQEITIGNPCPVVDRETGIIWLPFCKNNDSVLLTHSTDDGHTWSAPVDITQSVKKPEWGWYATGPGVGIQLSRQDHNGRLVIPCDHREQVDGAWIKKSHCFYSDDHGQSWQLGESVADHTDECQVVELHDGRLMINMRNYWARDGGKPELGQRRAVAISEDGGQSWGELRFDATLVEPVCQASFLRHNDDRFRAAPLLFSNPASERKRHRLTVRVSRDQGETWPDARLLHEGPSAYSCLAVLPDRSVGCLFEAGEQNAYEKIKFARFSVPWVTSP